MKNIFYTITFFILPLIGCSQAFIESKEFRLTKYDYSSIMSMNLSNEEYSDETSIFIVDKEGNKLKEIKVSAESYDNDSKVEELTSPKLKKVRKIIRTVIRHCACYCNTSKYYWLIMHNGKWIELPIIEQEDYEFGLRTKDYVFSKPKKDVIELFEYQDKMIIDSINNHTKFIRNSQKVINTFNWDGKVLRALKD